MSHERARAQKSPLGAAGDAPGEGVGAVPALRGAPHRDPDTPEVAVVCHGLAAVLLACHYWTLRDLAPTAGDVELLEDLDDILVAATRTATATGETISLDGVIATLGLTQDEIDTALDDPPGP